MMDANAETMSRLYRQKYVEEKEDRQKNTMEARLANLEMYLTKQIEGNKTEYIEVAARLSCIEQTLRQLGTETPRGRDVPPPAEVDGAGRKALLATESATNLFQSPWNLTRGKTVV